MSVTLKTKIADFYKAKFQDDDLGDQLDPEVTFEQVVDCIEDDPGNFYSLIGAGDSVVRERIFTAIAGLLHKPYQMIYDRWLDNDNPSIKESSNQEERNMHNLMEDKEFKSIVMEYVLEGHTIQESLKLAEDTITPKTLEHLEDTPAYRKMLRDIEYYFKACDGIEGYRDGDFKDAPIEALEDEADFCQETADFLGSINFKGFKPEVQQELMQATAKDMEYLDNSALRLKNILKKQDNSTYLNPDGSVNKNTNQKPGEYARRALRKIRDLFARLGQSWAYDPDFDYNSIPDVDYRNLVADYESKEWKQSIMHMVDEAVNEGICDQKILMGMGDHLNLDEEKKEFLDHYVYYIFG